MIGLPLNDTTLIEGDYKLNVPKINKADDNYTVDKKRMFSPLATKNPMSPQHSASRPFSPKQSSNQSYAKENSRRAKALRDIKKVGFASPNNSGSRSNSRINSRTYYQSPKEQSN